MKDHSGSLSEAAESGGEVLVVWHERDEHGFTNTEVMAAVLDAATGEQLRTFTAPGRSGSDTIWVRPVDGGFYVVLLRFSNATVHFVPHGGERLAYVTTFEVNGALDVVTTALGVLVLTADGVHSFDHFGVAGAVFTDEAQRDCTAGTVLRDGRVFARCYSWRTEQEYFVTMNADGSDAVELAGTRRRDDGWSSRVASADAGSFLSARARTNSQSACAMTRVQR